MFCLDDARGAEGVWGLGFCLMLREVVVGGQAQCKCDEVEMKERMKASK